MKGFTQIEILVAVGILGILTTLGVGAVQKSMDSARMTREIQAGRNLIEALQSSALENNGVYLPGMDYRVGGTGTGVYNTEGKEVTGHAAQRYPFRIAPYLGDKFDGTIFVNRNKAEIAQSSSGMYDYEVSAYPALGMNIYCVGGVMRNNGTILGMEDCISRSASMQSSILAFASGGSGIGKTKRNGFNYISPPTKANDSPYCLQWSSPDSWSENKDPMNYGWIDFRYKGKAVSVFMDGSIRLCSVEELSDMRLWSPSAKEADDPHYVLKP